MKNIIPKTYNEVIRKKRCYDLAKYFEVSNEILVEIYNFLSISKDNRISTTQNIISFYTGKNLIKSISVKSKTSSFDGITLSNNTFTVIPHYTSDISSSGGSSSNNNNNNKNNNNNN